MLKLIARRSFYTTVMAGLVLLCFEKGLFDPAVEFFRGPARTDPPKEEPRRFPPPPKAVPPPVKVAEDPALLLGEERTSARVQAFLSTFQQGEYRPSGRGRLYVVKEEGLEVLFDASDRLEKIVFHSDRSFRFRAFPEERLPEKISFSDTQFLVRARLGRPKYGDERWDRYERPQSLLDVEYEDDGENHCVLRISLIWPDAALPHPYDIAG